MATVCAHEIGQKTEGRAAWLSPVGAQVKGSYGKCTRCGQDVFELGENNPRPPGVPEKGIYPLGAMVFRVQA